MHARKISTPIEMKNALFSSTMAENCGFSMALGSTTGISA
jgi:hypothetical protein